MAGSADAPVSEPRVVGRYALFDEIAAGGMATVHYGRLVGPVGFSRTVAIKRLHPQFAKDREFVDMFLDEAKLASRIQHPNVVTTLDVVALEDELLLVMEYVQGESLSRLLRTMANKKQRVPPSVVLSIMSGMLHGLHAAHEATSEQRKPLNIVHRDISPQNVIVGIDGVARVLDFGVAKAAMRSQSTKDGEMKGKLSYMSPEQLNGKEVDRRSDLFSAGVVCWEALTGERLFAGSDAGEILGKVLARDIPRPSAVPPPPIEGNEPPLKPVSKKISKVVMRALERDPNARWQTAREFAIALEEAGRPATSHRVGAWVEEVAGEALQKRKQRLAEIESIPMDEVSPVEEASPDEPTDVDVSIQDAMEPPPVSDPIVYPEHQGRWKRLLTVLVVLCLLGWGLIKLLQPEDIEVLQPSRPVAPSTAAAAERASTQDPSKPALSASPSAEGVEGTAPSALPIAPEPESDPEAQEPDPATPPPGRIIRRPRTNCDPPWFVDKNGIKRIKKSCLGR